MSLIIFGDLFTFPDGYAATNRVYTYAKGIQEQGVAVHVICFSNDYVDRFDGVSDGIQYYHPFRQKVRNPSFLIRRWQNLKKYINTYTILKKINKEDKVIAVNSWTNLLATHLVIWIICKIIRTKLIVECNERPLRYYQTGRITKMYGSIKFFIESRLCNGVICISRYIVDYYRQHGVRERKLFLVPSTVDPDRFTGLQEKPRPSGKPYIGYFGSLTFYRDNIDLLINAFAIFNKSDNNINLVVSGFCTPDEKKSLINLIEKKGISDKVFILDYVTREEILHYVAHADVLVMVRCDDLDAKASYPSKLTEYLATGKPVVTVNVGEISDFITDKVNAFLIKPGDAEALADRLVYIFNNYDQATEIGKKGKELTAGVFNYKVQAKRMLEFIQGL